MKDDGSTAFVPDSIVHIQINKNKPNGEESVPLVWQDPANVTPGSGGGSNIDPNPDVWDFGIGSSLAKSVQEDIDFYQLSTGTMINVGAVTATHVSGDSTENSEVTVRFYPDDLVFDYGTNSTRKAFSYALFFARFGCRATRMRRSMHFPQVHILRRSELNSLPVRNSCLVFGSSSGTTWSPP